MLNLKMTNLFCILQILFFFLQESVLKSVEKKAKEQDSYWRNVLKLKDVEIENLKQNPVAVNSS